MERAKRAAEIVDLLRSLGHASALVGGVAVSIRTRERFTKDFDFAVAVQSDSETEALALAMQRAGFILSEVLEQEAKQIIATLRFEDPRSGTPEPEIDLLCASCGIEPEIVASATLVGLLPDVFLPVARVPHLIAMKVLSASDVRDQDLADLRALMAVASDAEIQEAANALCLIQERGFDRGKDLAGELARFTV